MKSILIIGLGRFGTHLCKDLSRLNNEIMIVDKDESKLEDLLPPRCQRKNRRLYQRKGAQKPRHR